MEVAGVANGKIHKKLQKYMSRRLTQICTSRPRGNYTRGEGDKYWKERNLWKTGLQAKPSSQNKSFKVSNHSKK